MNFRGSHDQAQIDGQGRHALGFTKVQQVQIPQGAFRIVEKVPGMTLDWLFLKSRDGLNVALHQRLEVAALQVAEEHRTRLASARRRAARR
jgi:hypothetical protein